jgi:hypothetical protein
MFQPAGSEIYTNEAGEPTGWGSPESAEDYYCDNCGYSHGTTCVDPYGLDEEIEEPPIEEHDPGPEIDDEGGMTEYRHQEPDTDRHRYNYED